MPHSDDEIELLDADGIAIPKEVDQVMNKRVPIAVVVLLVMQLFGLIWAAAASHTRQDNLATQFTTNFEKVYTRMDKMEQSIYTRQEATISLESIRQTNANQDQDIREINETIKDILIRNRASIAEPSTRQSK